MDAQPGRGYRDGHQQGREGLQYPGDIRREGMGQRSQLSRPEMCSYEKDQQRRGVRHMPAEQADNTGPFR